MLIKRKIMKHTQQAELKQYHMSVKIFLEESD